MKSQGVLRRFAAGLGLSLLGATAFASEATFQFGVPYPQTGPYAEYGANFSDGVRLAVKQVNEAGGITVDGKQLKVEPVFCDTQADSSRAATCGRRLSSQNQVSAMVIATSIETFPILSFNTRSRPPFLVISSSASEKLVAQKNPLVVRYWYNTYSYMPEFTRLLKEMLDKVEAGKDQVISVLQSEDEFGKAWADTLIDGWKAAGGTFGDRATWLAGATDFYPQLTALLKRNPTMLAIPSACAPIAPIVKQARELGFQGRFVVDLACEPGELSSFVDAEAFAGSIFLGSGWNTPSPAIDAFKTAYAEEFKRDAVAISADGFGQAMWLFRSVEAAGVTDDAAKIRAAMGSVTEQDWNLLAIGDLQESGETTAKVFPRVVHALDKIENYNP